MRSPIIYFIFPVKLRNHQARGAGGHANDGGEADPVKKPKLIIKHRENYWRGADLLFTKLFTMPLDKVKMVRSDYLFIEFASNKGWHLNNSNREYKPYYA